MQFITVSHFILEVLFFLIVIHLKMNLGQAPSRLSNICYKVDDHQEETVFLNGIEKSSEKS